MQININDEQKNNATSSNFPTFNCKMLQNYNKKSPLMLHTRFYLMRFIFIKFIRLLFLRFTGFISFHLMAMYTCASSHLFFPLSQCSFWALFHSFAGVLCVLVSCVCLSFCSNSVLSYRRNARWWAQLLLFCTWILRDRHFWLACGRQVSKQWFDVRVWNKIKDKIHSRVRSAWNFFST